MGRRYTVHPNRGFILSNNQAVKQMQPPEGACYKTFKRHQRFFKDRTQLIKTRSQQVVTTNNEKDDRDFNHNTHSQAQSQKAGPDTKVRELSVTETPKKIVKHKAKWDTEENITEIPKEDQVGLSDMPSEIMEQILSILPFKQRIRMQRTNQRIRELTRSNKLWKNITIQDSRITCSTMRNILRARPTTLNIPGCTWVLTPREEIEIENYLIFFEPRLTYLGLQDYQGNSSAIATVIFMAKRLTTLDISEANFALLSNILNRIDRTNLITTLNLSII